MLRAGAPGAAVSDRRGSVLTRLADYARLIRLDRPIGIWLLLWPTLWALWLASRGAPHESIFVVFVAGVVLTRSAGCAINDFADRRVDGHVARTAARPLATGRLSPTEAVGIYVVLSLSAFALVLTLDRLTIEYAVAGACLMFVYPFLKRVFPLPQVWLGAAFSWGIPMAFAAERHEVPHLAWMVFTAGVLWSTVYDTLYAMVDRDDDLRLGVKSTAILFGPADRAIIGLLQFAVLVTLWLAGDEAGLGYWFRGALGIGAMFFVWQQWLIRERDRDGCFRAFLNNHWFGLVVFLGIALDYLFVRGGHP